MVVPRASDPRSSILLYYYYYDLESIIPELMTEHKTWAELGGNRKPPKI